MKIAVVIIHCGLISILTYRLAKRWSAVRGKLFWFAFVYHLGAGLSVGLVYRYYYLSNDTWEFFNAAARLADLARKDFFTYVSMLFDFSWDQTPYILTNDFRSVIFIKMISLFCIISNDNYWLSTAYFSLMSFSASMFLYRKIVLYFKDSEGAAAMTILFFPSVVFWSSGIEKETLALVALYFLAGIFLQVYYDKRVDKLILFMILLASIVLWTLKYYWAGVFFISVISAFVIRVLSSKWLFLKNYLAASYIVIFLFIGVAVSFLHPNFYLHRFLEVVVSNHDAFVQRSNDQNLIHYYEFKATIKSILINSPWALFSGIFRPFIGEGQGIFGLLASVENLFILVLCFPFAWKFRNRSRPPVTVAVLAVVSYCIVLCVFLALSTPNLGTLSRYRVGFLPFFVFMIAYRNPLIDFATKKFSN